MTLFIVGTYILEVNRASFSQNQINPFCLLCKKEDETVEHFALQCESLEDIRRSTMYGIQRNCETAGLPFNGSDPASVLKFVFDCSQIMKETKLPDTDIKLIERQNYRRLCHML